MSRAAEIRSQLGVEVTPGTAVAATVQLPGLLTMRHAPERVLREEYRASWGGSNTHDDLSLESTGQYVGRCTSSTLIYWLLAGMRGDVTPTGASPYTWLFKQPLTDVPIPDLKFYTAYWGTSTSGGGGALRAPGVIVTRIVIEGTDKAAWTVRCDLLGKGVIAGTFDTSKKTLTNESVKNLLSSLYIAGSWTALDALTSPTTDATLCTAYGFTWTWESGITNDFAMNADLNRCDINRGIPNVTLQLRLKWNALAAAQAVHAINGTRRFIRLDNIGTASSTIKIAGSYDPMTYDVITDQRDGTVRGTMDLVGVEDPAAGTPRKCEVTCINSTSNPASPPS